jgi:Fumarase C C-terminus
MIRADRAVDIRCTSCEEIAMNTQIPGPMSKCFKWQTCENESVGPFANPLYVRTNLWRTDSGALVTALSPVIGYDKASKIAHYANDNDLTLKAAALKLGFVTEAEFDSVVDPKKMVRPYVAPPVAA